MKALLRLLTLLCVAVSCAAPALRAASLMENLGRGVVAVRASTTDVYVGWRMLGTDTSGVAFNLYRSTGGGAPVRLNAAPLTATTDFTDASADLTQTNAYFVRPVVGGSEGAPSASFSLPANAPVQQFLSVPLHVPANGLTPDGLGYAYTANDCSVADLDGDGEYEIIVKWDPTNSKDNSQSGYTGNVFLDGYKLDGTRLWRIDLGRNIRAGAHYTQFLVYDFDGDGRAELVCKTAPNTKDGTGTFIGQPGKFLGTPVAPIDHTADYRNGSGYVLTGPEFFTVFDGLTGAELATTNYVVPRNGNPASSDVSAWGDNYGNRVDRFLACVAYLDGQRPSLVLCRGYYTRAVLAAWDWRNGQLTQRWVFDTGVSGGPYATWKGQGAHSLTVGDVDGDGRDEIIYGAAAIDDDGSGLYSTQLGHGDALHLSDMDPNRPGQEVWMVHEDPGSYGSNGLEFRDARTGSLIFGVSGQGSDVGRGVAGDIDPRFAGYEMWGSRGGLNAVDGTQITPSRPGQMNFMIWWDGDLLRELLDGTTISKWNWNTNTVAPLFAPGGVSSNNSTKANPALSADILGDWREEVIWRTSDSSALRIYTTTTPATNRIHTLMHDRQYRLAIAWQNVGYNQPPHPSFYIGEGMTTPPPPDIVTSLAALPPAAPAVTSINRYDPFSVSTGATAVTFRVTFNQAVSGVDAGDFVVTRTGTVSGTVSNVTAHSSVAYNVTVGSITGSGTIRLDLKSSGTGITGSGGTPIAGGFTAGQTYSRATLAWINPVSGGHWSNAANWDGGVIADGIGAVPIFGNFDLTADNTVVLDTPRTVSGLTFGDAAPASAASWIISDGGASNNVLTLDPPSGLPTNTVNTLGSGASVTLDVAIAGTDGLAKSGPGTLVLVKPATLTGQINVAGGALRVGAGGALDPGTSSVNISSGAQLGIAGGSFATRGLVTASGGALVLDGGTAALNGGFRTNSDFGSTLRVNNGTLTATDVNIRRNSASSVDFNSGFVVTGGTATVGTIWLGNSNSNGAMSVDGGNVVATGALTIGNNSNSSRGGGLRVRGGEFTAADTVNGIILTRANGNHTSATFSGGVSTVEKITFGLSPSVTAGSGVLTLSSGALYLGAGGLVRHATGSYAATVALNGGTLGAKASWATVLPITLGGAVVIKAADASDAPLSIALAGVLSGAGGFTKSGDGSLSLAAANTFAGPVGVDAGTLRITGSIASGGAFHVRAGGTLAGNGTIQRTVTLDGGNIAPDGASAAATLTATSLTWQSGMMIFDLGATSDRLVLADALSKAGSGSYVFQFVCDETVAPGSYTVASFGSTTFTGSDFTATGLPPGLAGRFAVTGNELRLIVYGPPVIQSPGTAGGIFGAPFSYTIAATESPTSFEATGLPPGLSIDTATGVISGTPAAAGVFNVTLRATNAAGTGTAPLALTIAKAIAPVVIGSSPTAPIREFYTGAPIPASATTTPSGLSVAFTYNGNTTVPTLPGTYAVVGNIDDANYEGTGSGTLVIVTTARVRHAPSIAGSIDGSVHVLLAEDVTLKGDISNDLLVPGTPHVVANGRPTFVGTKDGSGASEPASHRITLNGGAVVRYVVRRVDPVGLPVLSPPQSPVGTRDVVLNNANQSAGDYATVRDLTSNGNAGAVALPPGAYRTLTANGNSSFVLGVPGATSTAVYDVQHLALNGSATLQVVGPVRLKLASDFTLTTTAGAAAQPGWLTLEVASGNVSLKGAATLHGEILAPGGAVTLTGTSTLRGTVSADRLVITGGALLQQAAP